MSARSCLAVLRGERGDALIYTALAVFAALTMAGSTLPSHRVWGAVAAPGYACGAALVGVGYLVVRRMGEQLRRRVRLAVLGAVVLMSVVAPMAVLIGFRAAGQPHSAVGEVIVVEASGGRLAHTGNPYAGPAEIATAIATHSTRVYCPYLPAMAVFGLPRALAGASVLTDARVIFLLAGAAILLLAFALRRWSRPPPVRGLQLLLLSPLLALPVAVGGDDVPVLALLFLGFVLAERRSMVWAGVAVGLASAMKLTAWPVAVVLGMAVLVMLGRRSAVRFAGATLAVIAGVVVPFAVADPHRLIEHVIRFPFGMTELRTPAASPLLGYWIEHTFPYGHQIATVLLLVVGVGFAGYLLHRPPRSMASAALLAGVGLSLAFALAPSTRFGYFIYPVVLIAWWMLARVPAGPTVDEELDALLDSEGRRPALTH